MIKRWSVKNFKSIRAEAKLEFAPLTLFAGQNSAGKSTLIQSILLTAQTIQSNVFARSVVLNGRILRLGSFSDIRANNSSEQSVTIGFDLARPTYGLDSFNVGVRARYYYAPELQAKMQRVTTSFSFSAGESDRNKELQLQPRLEQGCISYHSNDAIADNHFEFARLTESPEERLSTLNVAPEDARIPDSTALGYRVVTPAKISKGYARAYRVPADTKAVGVLLRHFLPVSVAGVFDSVTEQVNSQFETLTDPNAVNRYRVGADPISRDFLLNPAVQRLFIEAANTAAESLPEYLKDRAMAQLKELPESLTIELIGRILGVLQTQGRKALVLSLSERESEIKRLLRANRPARNEIAPFPIAEPVQFATEYVTGFFSERLKYLGPLRDEPKAIYPLAGYNDPRDIGYKGEFTAAVLDNNGTSYVSYVPSAHFPFATKQQATAIHSNLIIAVKDWLEYLGIAKSVATEDKGKLGHELTIAITEAANLHDLTHVGVGVSQALPIVVLSLLAEPGSTLIFEQPELHLNPKVQTRLADFFMSLVFAGKQCVVETHSEYLISRLRYLSAVAVDTPMAQLMKIYFVEKQNDQSVYSEVEMSDGGVIKNWPSGFFDETELNSASIIEAQIERTRARKRAKEGGDSH